MTDRDPDLQAHVDAATADLAARVAAIAALADPDAWARDFIEHLCALGWRPVPRPAPLAGAGPKNPDAYARGAERARDLYARRPTGPYRPTEGDTDA